jgi:U32 family peptidase
MELLMPAGSPEKMRTAFRFGADAVYAGVPILSLRARENDFNLEQLELAIKEAHALSKKIYLTANIFSRNLKIKLFTEQLDKWAQFKPDALIMSDPGLISIVKERHPEIEVHLSVQANCTNWRSVKFWKDQGLSRIILSRELRSTEIREIHERVPDIELEAFVHGSICIAYSGRCLLSHYMSYRDANQGVCDNSCRYPYRLFQNGNPVGDDFWLQDLRDPENLYPVEEDEHGTYILNAKDLCLIEHLQEIADAGVCSFKVEGRTKSDFYVAIVTQAYRKAIDDMKAGRPFDRSLLNDLDRLAHRGYHTGFMRGSTDKNSQNYEATARGAHSHLLGLTLQERDDQFVEIEPKSKVTKGQEVELLSPGARVRSTVLEIRDSQNAALDSVSAGRKTPVFVRFDKKTKPSSYILRVE